MYPNRIRFTGTTCRHDIDECESNPCQNGGTCENLINEYECTCGRLYYGDHCEKSRLTLDIYKYVVSLQQKVTLANLIIPRFRAKD